MLWKLALHFSRETVVAFLLLLAYKANAKDMKLKMIENVQILAVQVMPILLQELHCLKYHYRKQSHRIRKPVSELDDSIN